MVTSFEHSLFHVKTQMIFVQGKQLRLTIQSDSPSLLKKLTTK